MSCHAARRLDLLGYGDSPVHRLDGRAKVLFGIVYTVCVVSFPKYATTDLVPFLVFPVLLGALGRVPARLVLRIILVTAPFAVLAGALNPWLDPASVTIFGRSLSAGWFSFASILLRFVLTVGLLMVLTATTSFPGLLDAFSRLGVPSAVVTVLLVIHRYLFVLAGEADRMGHARALRDPGHRLPRPAAATRMFAALLFRTVGRAERIHGCLSARGFRGEFPRRLLPRLRFADVALLAAGAAGCVALRLLPVTEWAGQAILAGGR